MGQILTNNSFTYNGQTYFFQASIYVKEGKYESRHGLDSDECIEFQYQNQMNSLAIPASMIYQDKYGIIDKYLEKQYAYCSVIFANVKTTTDDGGVETKSLDEEAIMAHDFLITKIEILQRNGTEIVYKLHMISINWINLASIVNYSNYSKNPEQIFDIVKNIIKLANLDIDQRTFDLVKSDVKINYITNGNDTVDTSIKYLLSRMLSYKQHDKSWKFIYYDEQLKRYKLFDISNYETLNGFKTIFISLFNSTTEQLMQSDPIGINTINSFTNAQVFRTSFSCKRTDYDYMHNVFVDDVLKNEDIVQFRNKSFIDDVYKQKYETLFDSTLDFSKKANFWNDNLLLDQYNNFSKTFCENNGLVVVCAGEIQKKPSDLVQIVLDRKVENITSEDPEIEDDVVHRYSGFEGAWITAKVHNIISVREGYFTAKLMLFRNFITDTIEQSAK